MGEGEKQADERMDGRGWVVLFLFCFFLGYPGFGFLDMAWGCCLYRFMFGGLKAYRNF